MNAMNYINAAYRFCQPLVHQGYTTIVPYIQWMNHTSQSYIQSGWNRLYPYLASGYKASKPIVEQPYSYIRPYMTRRNILIAIGVTGIGFIAKAIFSAPRTQPKNSAQPLGLPASSSTTSSAQPPGLPVSSSTTSSAQPSGLPVSSSTTSSAQPSGLPASSSTTSSAQPSGLPASSSTTSPRQQTLSSGRLSGYPTTPLGDSGSTAWVTPPPALIFGTPHAPQNSDGKILLLGPPPTASVVATNPPPPPPMPKPKKPTQGTHIPKKQRTTHSHLSGKGTLEISKDSIVAMRGRLKKRGARPPVPTCTSNSEEKVANKGPAETKTTKNLGATTQDQNTLSTQKEKLTRTYKGIKTEGSVQGDNSTSQSTSSTNHTNSDKSNGAQPMTPGKNDTWQTKSTPDVQANKRGAINQDEINGIQQTIQQTLSHATRRQAGGQRATPEAIKILRKRRAAIGDTPKKQNIQSDKTNPTENDE